MFDNRERWLMHQALAAGQSYQTLGQWLGDMVCDTATVEMALAKDAPTRHLPAEVMSLATAVIDFRNQMRVQVLEHKLLPAEYDTMCEIALAIKEETK